MRNGTRSSGTNPRAMGTNPRATGTNPRLAKNKYGRTQEEHEAYMLKVNQEIDQKIMQMIAMKKVK